MMSEERQLGTNAWVDYKMQLIANEDFNGDVELAILAAKGMYIAWHHCTKIEQGDIMVILEG